MEFKINTVFKCGYSRDWYIGVFAHNSVDGFVRQRRDEFVTEDFILK